MWSHNSFAAMSRPIRFVMAMALAGLAAGCFQPLYGEQPTLGSKPGGDGVRTALASVDVKQIAAPKGTPEARLAVEVRNNLLFDLTGGESSISPTHRLDIQQTLSRSAIIVDITTGRTEAEITGVDATYTLVNLATGKPVVTGRTFSRVTSDIPGQQQRFAHLRAQRDAEDRAAHEIADRIRDRLASYFIAGT